MNKNKVLLLKNCSTGLVSQVMTLIFQFLTRSLFIRYIGIELLGVYSTFTSVLSTLSLAELGFQTAIVFSLYKPLAQRDEQQINDIVNVFRFVYDCIGAFFILASLALLPFLKYILTGITVTNALYLYFLIQAFSSACTYFLAYKRALLYADQKDYISKIIDMAVNVIANILQIIAMVYFKDYLLYLVLKLMQVIVSNIWVHWVCARLYPFLKREKINFTLLRSLFSNVKNVFAGKIATYVYSSTDSLVISAFISTVQVGYLVNYTTISQQLKTLISGLLNPITPMIGNVLATDSEGESKEGAFKLYAVMRVLIAMMIVVPFCVLINDFIAMWVGAEYILPASVVVLLVMDLYIHFVHSVNVDFINAAGLFREDRDNEIIAAVLNITLSILGAKTIGLAGVLLGTVVSQMWFWFGRSYVVFKLCLQADKEDYLKYWLKNIVDGVALTVSIVFCAYLNSRLPIANGYLKFVCSGILCEAVSVALFGVFHFGDPEVRKMLKYLVNHIRKR